jgi:hypothetical protein
MSCKGRRAVVEQGPGATGHKASSARSIILNRDWLSRNAYKYREEWVALRDGKLLAHDPCSRTLRKWLKDNRVSMDGVLVLMPGHFYNASNELIW